MVELDGSIAEGGGQILRTAVTLSVLTGRPFHISRIRENRGNPGLQPQHLAAVQAAAQISAAQVVGASLGSPELSFEPTRCEGGAISVDAATTGSATLIVQTLLLVLSASGRPSSIAVHGVNYSPNTPTPDFLRTTFIPLLARLGHAAVIDLERAAFPPDGRGQITAEIQPGDILSSPPLGLEHRGELRGIGVSIQTSGSRWADLDKAQVTDAISRHLGHKIDATHGYHVPEGSGNGIAVSISAVSENVTETFSSVASRGARLTRVIRTAAGHASGYLASHAAVGELLADQLLLPLALGAGGHFSTVPPSPHFHANCKVIEQFLPVKFSWRPESQARGLVEVVVNKS
jgi:RNA 3'-terminal phosphate cyclase (ATP)